MKTCNLRLALKLKKIHDVLEFNQSQCLKQYVEFNTHTKRIEAEKNGDKDLFDNDLVAIRKNKRH